MSYRTVDPVPEEIPEIEPVLEAVLLQALEIAREKADAGEDLVPFTALAVGETLFMETHPSEDPEECFREAQHTVQNARGAAAYAFCYDGYIDSNEGELDAIIAEGGIPGEPFGHAVGYLYTLVPGEESVHVSFDDSPLYIGRAPNFMEFTLALDEDELEEEAADDEDVSDDKKAGDDEKAADDESEESEESED